MQFSPRADITYSANTATTITLNIANSPLVVGDFVFFNEWTGTDAARLNFQTGYVTVAAAPLYTITFPNANLVAAGTYTPGIVQYLTTRKDTTLDCIRWYDGDPTENSGIRGWVNFTPPLSQLNFGVGELPAGIYYLVSARMMIQYKDRLLFIGPVVQASSGNPIYLQDTVIYIQNGTPYYTCSSGSGWRRKVKSFANPSAAGMPPSNLHGGIYGESCNRLHLPSLFPGTKSET